MPIETTKRYIARRVKVAMFDNGLNITSLAKGSGIGRNTVYNVLNGANYNIDNLVAVLDFLGLDLIVVTKGRRAK